MLIHVTIMITVKVTDRAFKRVRDHIFVYHILCGNIIIIIPSSYINRMNAVYINNKFLIIHIWSNVFRKMKVTREENLV